MDNQLLMIFVKNPELGKAKTRLAASIGDEAALKVYKRLLEKTKEITLSLPFSKAVFYSQFIDTQDLWSNEHFTKKLQSEGDLGQKMETAFDWAFQNGFQKVCIIGSDCYDLTTDNLNEAFECLDNHNAVIGPARDGGYYLLGLSKACSSIFQNKQWSTDSVCSDTEKDFQSEGTSYKKLKTLNDVDTIDDLGSWASDLIQEQ